MLTIEQLLALQAVVDDVFVHHAVHDYAVRLVMATRDPATLAVVPEIAPHIALGASPRATLGLLAAGRALAVAARPPVPHAAGRRSTSRPRCCATA